MAIQQIIFVGLSGYDYPHTRVRCYNFAERLNQYPDFTTRVISFKDHLSNLSEVEIYGARDRQKLLMSARALPKLFPRRNTLFYIQKAHYNSALPYLLSRLGFNRYIFDYDDYDVDLNVTFNSKKLRRLFFGSDDHAEITRRLAADALGCVAASRNLSDFIRPINPRVEYVPTGVKPDLFTCTDRSGRSGPIRFLWTGIIWGEEIYQGVLQVLDGFRGVIRSGFASRLELVGTGQMWDRMAETLQGQYDDITRYVDLTGWVHPDDMPKILARADVGLLPFSQDSLWIRSKSPTKLFEYMASGLPVIASAIGEVTHVIEHGRSGLLADGAAAFHAAMIELAGDPDRRRLLGLAARARVETHYSIPVLVDRLARYLEMLIRLKA